MDENLRRLLVSGLLGQGLPVQNRLSGLLGMGAPSAPATANLNMLAQGLRARENQMMRGIMATPWHSEFIQQFGERPDLSPQSDYNYRLAWLSGARPERDPYDNNRYHWPSSTSSGEMLKRENHPTVWKEMFMRATGQNPDALGIKSADEANQYLRRQK